MSQHSGAHLQPPRIPPARRSNDDELEECTAEPAEPSPRKDFQPVPAGRRERISDSRIAPGARPTAIAIPTQIHRPLATHRPQLAPVPARIRARPAQVAQSLHAPLERVQGRTPGPLQAPGPQDAHPQSTPQTEKLLNSFQRLDAFTGTILPSDLTISFSFFKWAPSRESPPESEQQQQQQQHHHHQQQSRPAGKSKKGREDGPGAYLTPNRILHPYWVSKKAGMSVWILCHQDILKHRKKLRPLYRFTHEPKFSPHLADQIASQLVRRVAQESVVLRASLGRPRSGTVASLDHLVGAARPGTTPRISEHPAVASGPVLLRYLNSLLPSSPAGPEDPGPPVGQDLPDPSASLGAILVKSSSLFRQLAALQSPEGSSPAPLSTKQGPAERQDALLFSLDLRDGPVPVWDLEGLLARMAKPPPRAASGTPLVTAAVGGPSTVSAETSLATVLAGQIDEALRGPGCPLTADTGAYLVPLAERTYPLILALRRATWWLGQGFEPAHFAAIRSMLDEALARKHLRHTQWLHWIRSRNTVEGKIKRNGQLWVPFETRSGTPRKLWRRV